MEEDYDETILSSELQDSKSDSQSQSSVNESMGGFNDSIFNITQQIAEGDKYKTSNVIGTGGMGYVLSSKDKNIDRDIAMKILKAQNDNNALARFIDEARITG